MNNTATEAQKNVVVINAAFAIQVVRPEKTIEECIALAKESLESVQRELGRCIFWEKTTNYEDVIISKDGEEWKIVRNKRDK